MNIIRKIAKSAAFSVVAAVTVIGAVGVLSTPAHAGPLIGGEVCTKKICSGTSGCSFRTRNTFYPRYACEWSIWGGECSNFGTALCKNVKTYAAVPCSGLISDTDSNASVCGM